MHLENPLVSVILPAYNAQVHIAQAVDSVLTQDYTNLELLVIDDGSTDGTADHPCLQDPRIRVLRQHNAGPASARNLGLTQAKGELIAFIDADDLWLTGKLSLQVAYLRDHPEISIVFGGFQRWLASPDKRFEVPLCPRIESTSQALAQPSGWLYTDLLLDSVVHIITAMVRRSVFDTVGVFDTRLPTGEDYDFWLRASRQFKLDQLAQTVACYRIHAGSLTKVPRPENNEYLVLQHALASWGGSGPDGRSVDARSLQNRLFGICFGHAYFHFWHGDRRRARHAFGQALQHAFWHPKVWAYWLISAITSSATSV
ncbi:glycosyltransferase [Rhodoferax sp. U11-2br]|uniref:glycosyltransferase family 2 protein n=1 Tax=Rhodoferax sp. U11-2br TaxID=2838878 RepID=UPI001BE9BCDE|nr:glycosyltransferase [Rhodoferax sp. U11-2br]MBT3067037.1 glycosyltransferase [Rhodoferax sp. U11-2br]